MVTVLKPVPTLWGPVSAAVVLGTHWLAMDEGVTVSNSNFHPTSRMHCTPCVISDVNECMAGNGGCDQTCADTLGSFVCSCLSGFRLASDGETCNGQC